MFLIDGFKYGFHLSSVGQSRSYESPNVLSARQQPQVNNNNNNNNNNNEYLYRMALQCKNTVIKGVLS